MRTRHATNENMQITFAMDKNNAEILQIFVWCPKETQARPQLRNNNYVDGGVFRQVCVQMEIELLRKHEWLA